MRTNVKAAIAAAVAVPTLLVGCAPLEEPASSDTTSEQAPEPATEEKHEPAPEPEPEEPESTLTVAQQNAITSAKDYLDFSAFSKKGLREQLEFEGFTKAEAKFAVNNISVNWREQAARSAEDYLSFSSFSRSGLIEQLMFEGFTRKQAAYGATENGL